MGAFVKGEVVVTQFPFSDRSDSKKRPAVVVAVFAEAGVLLVAQVTSRLIEDEFAIALTDSDFQSGGLRTDSFVRTNFLFTCAEELVLYSAGKLRHRKHKEIVGKLVEMLQRE